MSVTRACGDWIQHVPNTGAVRALGTVVVAVVLGWASLQPAQAQGHSADEAAMIAVEHYGGETLSVSPDGDYLIVRLLLPDGRVIDVAVDRWFQHQLTATMRRAFRRMRRALRRKQVDDTVPSVAGGVRGDYTVGPLRGGSLRGGPESREPAHAGECSTDEAAKIGVERHGGKALSVSPDGEYFIARLQLPDGRVIDIAVDRWGC